MNSTARKYLGLILLIAVFVTTGGSRSKMAVGRIERNSLPKYDISLQGRVDTCAHTSSMHAIDPKVMKINKNKYIEFDTEDSKGQRYHIRAKLYREASIKSTTGDANVRYVIREEVKLGDVTKTININLSDREQLKYNFLIGRNLLRGDFVVDVSQSHILGD